MFGEDLSATTSCENLDDMFGEDLSATPAAEAEMDDMFGEICLPLPSLNSTGRYVR
jgi:hypothetical protein